LQTCRDDANQSIAFQILLVHSLPVSS
jgi:hypothetical protein